ncbi:hypothetical protein ACFQ7N_10630 [Streptomyces niveus]|uniref:hypothetical protein n=1 Tax=Streptomyces niveus TaxID=193462 RepID=UPI0036BBBD39
MPTLESLPTDKPELALEYVGGFGPSTLARKVPAPADVTADQPTYNATPHAELSLQQRASRTDATICLGDARLVLDWSSPVSPCRPAIQAQG